MGKKVVFIIQSYNAKEGESLKDFCQLEVYAKCEDEAIKKAKSYIKKKEYRVSHVIEK